MPAIADGGAEGSLDGKNVKVSHSRRGDEPEASGISGAGSTGSPKLGSLPESYNVFEEADLAGKRNCVKRANGTVECRASQTSCVRQASYTKTADGDFVGQAHGGPVVAGPNQATRQVTRVDTGSGARTDLGYRCVDTTPSTSGGTESAPVVITVTQTDFKRLGVKPLRAHAGPAKGWLPVNMVNVLHADSAEQMLNTTLLGTPVSIRAIPTSYHWDLGDGNTITTTKAGKAYPSEEVSARYVNEGWYDITLTTTFAGQFSVNGGHWQDIEGTIEIASEPVAIYSKSLEGRLTNPHDTTERQGPQNVGYDPETDDVPARSAATEGPRDPNARHRRV